MGADRSQVVEAQKLAVRVADERERKWHPVTVELADALIAEQNVGRHFASERERLARQLEQVEAELQAAQELANAYRKEADELEDQLQAAQEREKALREYAEYMERKNPTSTWDLAMKTHFVDRAREALHPQEGELEQIEALEVEKSKRSAWRKKVDERLAFMSQTADRLQRRAASPSEKPATHGRNCPCTPCRAEDWDKIERNLYRPSEKPGSGPNLPPITSANPKAKRELTDAD